VRSLHTKYLLIGDAKLHLAVKSAGTHQSRVQSVWSIGCHQHLDIATRLEAIELVDELKHCTLDFIVAARAVVKTSSANGINLVEKHYAGLLGTTHLEQFTHHPRTLATAVNSHQ